MLELLFRPWKFLWNFKFAQSPWVSLGHSSKWLFFHNGRFLNVKLRGSRWRPHSLCLFVCTVLGEKGAEKPEIEFILIQPPLGASNFAFFYPAWWYFESASIMTECFFHYLDFFLLRLSLQQVRDTKQSIYTEETIRGLRLWAFNWCLKYLAGQDKNYYESRLSVTNQLGEYNVA